VKEFLKGHGISVLDWPGNSPDLKMAIEINGLEPSSKENLKTIIEKGWFENFSQEYIDKLIEFMPRRIEAVIKKKGGPTKYWFRWISKALSIVLICIFFHINRLVLKLHLDFFFPYEKFKNLETNSKITKKFFLSLYKDFFLQITLKGIVF
jgi:hypothetical protein